MNKHRTERDAMSWLKDMVIALLCGMAMFVFADFIRNPEKYGEIMARYDSARFAEKENQNAP